MWNSGQHKTPGTSDCDCLSLVWNRTLDLSIHEMNLPVFYPFLEETVKAASGTKRRK